jgi:hypothetical protein
MAQRFAVGAAAQGAPANHRLSVGGVGWLGRITFSVTLQPREVASLEYPMSNKEFPIMK